MSVEARWPVAASSWATVSGPSEPRERVGLAGAQSEAGEVAREPVEDAVDGRLQGRDGVLHAAQRYFGSELTARHTRGVPKG